MQKRTKNKTLYEYERKGIFITANEIVDWFSFLVNNMDSY